MPACHAGERGSIPRRGGIKLPPHPKLGWSPIFAFSPSPCRWSLFLFYIIFKDNTTIIFKTIPRPDAGPAGRATKRGSPESAPTSVSLFLSLRWFIFNRTSTRVTSSRPTPVFQKNKQGTGQDFSDEDECFFFSCFSFRSSRVSNLPRRPGIMIRFRNLNIDLLFSFSCIFIHSFHGIGEGESNFCQPLLSIFRQISEVTILVSDPKYCCRTTLMDRRGLSIIQGHGVLSITIP